MNIQQRILAVVVAVGLLAFIVDLVRRKKLTEEFSILWLLAGTVILVTATTDKVYNFISALTGIVTPTSIAFFFGIVFLLGVCLQLSMKLSENKTRIKDLAQKLALYEQELAEKERRATDENAETHEP